MKEEITKKDRALALEKVSAEELNALLEEHYPIQYIIGDVEFLNSVIRVDERVLIPRFETELLVEKTIKRIKLKNINDPNILELGTGSGCIAIALKKNIECSITAVDNACDALDLARDNAILNETSITFICEDMLNLSYKGIDLLISNPPYVNNFEWVAKETKYEPQRAIFAPHKGIYFYEEIIKKIANDKTFPKIVAFEIGENEGNDLITLTKEWLPNYQCFIEQDLTRKDRYAFLELNE